MRLLVVSDSHGYDEELEFVLKNITYDAAIHCGDCHFDKKSSFLKLFDVIVQGNHDEDFLPLEMTFKTPLGEIFVMVTLFMSTKGMMNYQGISTKKIFQYVFMDTRMFHILKNLKTFSSLILEVSCLIGD